MRYLSVIILVLVFAACKKDVITIFQVEEVMVDQPGADKPNVKESVEYISIAYSDVYGKSVPSSLLDELTTSYVSFADNTIIEDLIIRNFLNDPAASVPTDASMRADVPAFVKNCYNQFYGREPSGQEQWYVEKLINENSGLAPDVIYYTFLTSNEYRQF